MDLHFTFNFSISFFIISKAPFFCCYCCFSYALPIFLLRICVDLKKKEENITVLDIIHIQFYDSFPYIFLELIVSFKYISCAKRHEGDIKNRNLQYKFFSAAAIYEFFFIRGRTQILRVLCLCIISDVLRVIVNWSGIFSCLLPLKEKLE